VKVLNDELNNKEDVLTELTDAVYASKDDVDNLDATDKTDALAKAFKEDVIEDALCNNSISVANVTSILALTNSITLCKVTF